MKVPISVEVKVGQCDNYSQFRLVFIRWKCANVKNLVDNIIHSNKSSPK